MADGGVPIDLVDRIEWRFNFKAPDYDGIYAARTERLLTIRKTPGMLEGLHEHYADHPADFIRDWGMTFDPRLAEIGLPTIIPFVLFPKQAEFIDWLYARWKAREDGLGEKSRDMGVSWLCVAFAVWMWRYQPGSVVGFGSRKEEYVDKIGDPKSLFWKARQFIELLPIEFRPEGYSSKLHAPHMRILNPVNGSAIVGEAGDNIGRGNRASIYFKDESAFYEHAEAIDAALSQTSNCKIDISTPNGPGNAFARKRQAGKIPVFTFHWRDDPRKDDAWYARQKATLDAVIVAQEIDIDYAASRTDAWIPGTLIAAAQKVNPADIVPIGRWIVAVDAAHFGNDESVIHSRKGRLNLDQIERKGYDGVQLAYTVEQHCKELEQFGEPVFAIVVELDGPGVSCFDQLKLGKYATRVHGVHTGVRLSDDINYNVRAKIWRDARDYLRDAPVRLPRDGDLASQLGAMKYSFKDGLLLMQDKKQYKKENGRSPDNADAFVLTFAAPAYVADIGSFEPGHGRNGGDIESFE